MASIAMNSANVHQMAQAGLYGVSQPEWMTSEHSTGTTTMALEYDGGVVMAADSRTTTGSYVANRVTDKITPVTERIFCCRSGSAADTQAVADIVRYNLNIYRMQMEREPTVHTAANVFRDMCYGYREQISAGIIVGGWDKDNGGQVYRVPIGGMLIRQPISIGGSGSTYIYGYVDAHYKPKMSKTEALQFCANSLALAMMRDGSSGGVIRLAAINGEGVERHTVTGDDIPKFYEG